MITQVVRHVQFLCGNKRIVTYQKTGNEGSRSLEKIQINSWLTVKANLNDQTCGMTCTVFG